MKTDTYMIRNRYFNSTLTSVDIQENVILGGKVIKKTKERAIYKETFNRSPIKIGIETLY